MAEHDALMAESQRTGVQQDALDTEEERRAAADYEYLKNYYQPWIDLRYGSAYQSLP